MDFYGLGTMPHYQHIIVQISKQTAEGASRPQPNHFGRFSDTRFVVRTEPTSGEGQMTDNTNYYTALNSTQAYLKTFWQLLGAAI